MENRRPRINLALTEQEKRWLEWWAAETGRPYAEAGGRLLSRAIEEKRADPALERAYQEDLRRGPIERALIGELDKAFAVPGMLEALEPGATPSSDEAARAARYIQDVSTWLLDPRLPDQKGPPPDLADTPAVVLQDAGFRHAVETVGKRTAGFRTQHPPKSHPAVPDKRQLSGSGAPAWLDRYAGRAGVDSD